MLLRLLNCVAAGLLLSASVQAEVSYEKEIKPLLASRCNSCHGVLKQEAGLRLDAIQLIRKGGDSGEPLSVSEPTKSELLRRITAPADEGRMPPSGEGEALKPDQIELLKTWIREGAKGPGAEPAPSHPREHWSFQGPVRPDLSALPAINGSTHPIDLLLGEQQAAAGVRPVEPADRRTLIRRLTIDLSGLPPTIEEVDRFVSESNPQTIEQRIDDLLARPEYGERWGRHWMDVWRYSDWDGYGAEVRGSQKHIWRWRDWIVESLNANRPYDQMVHEMLAGDEIAPDSTDTLRATGFLSRNYYKFNRQLWLDQVIEHTGKAFLGLTFNCAKCHDHKFDPISHQDYYRFQAIFAPHQLRTDPVPNEPSIEKDGLTRAYDADAAAKTYLLIRGDERNPDKSSEMTPALPAIFEADLAAAKVQLPPRAVYPFLFEPILTQTRQPLEAERQAALKTVSEAAAGSPDARIARLKLQIADGKQISYEARLTADRAKLLKEREDELAILTRTAVQSERTLAELQAVLALEQALIRKANADADPPAEMEAAKLEKERTESQQAVTAAQTALDTLRGTPLPEEHTATGKAFPAESTGQRLALARWLTRRDNPLTARVAVNQMWMRHFGTPLVDSVFDFGLRAPTPRQQKLLDWLAVEFIESGWNMKHMHRLIVTSQAYQRASSPLSEGSIELWQANEQLDPDNRLFWKSAIRRLDAESVRDAVLACSESLDRTRGGADIPHVEGEKSHRRSLYFQTAYEKQMQFLTTFDVSNPEECYRRKETIMPHQALALSNSPLAISQSRILADRLWSKTGEGDEAARTTAFITLSFQQLLGRPASAEEIDSCQQFLVSQAERLSRPDNLTPFTGGEEPARAAAVDPSQRARENLIHVLFNHNDFLSVR